MNFWGGIVFILILWTISNMVKGEAQKTRLASLGLAADVILAVAFIVAYCMGKSA